jgi:hypothetical protein
MSTSSDPARGQTEPADAEQELARQIQQTRDELGAAVHSLVNKTDVKARVAEQAKTGKDRLRQSAQRVRALAPGTSQQQAAAAIAVVCALVAGVLVPRLRARR